MNKRYTQLMFLFQKYLNYLFFLLIVHSLLYTYDEKEVTSPGFIILVDIKTTT